MCEQGERAPIETGHAAVYAAMMLALRDYVNKNRFPGVVIGLSGGIDSALTAAVAVDALGADRVRCVMMPSRYTAQESLDDAAEIAKLLGVDYDIVPIENRRRQSSAPCLRPCSMAAPPTPPKRTSSRAFAG